MWFFTMHWSIGQRCTSWQTPGWLQSGQQCNTVTVLLLLLSYCTWQEGAQELRNKAVMVSLLIWSSYPVLCPWACARLIALSADLCSLNCGLGVSDSSPWNKGKLEKVRKGEMQTRNKEIGAFVIQRFQVHEERPSTTAGLYWITDGIMESSQ